MESMVRKTVLVIAFFPFISILLIVNLSMLAYHSRTNTHRLNASAPSQLPFNLTAASNTSQVINATVIAADARALLLHSFMSKHKSPMAEYADAIVTEAERYGIDFRLVPAIAMCESNLGKHMPSNDSYNPFGIAVYTGQKTGKKFDSWLSSIQWVTKYIKEKYYDRGLVDLKDIGAVWAPPSVGTDYSWTKCVQSFMDSIAMNPS
jgi:hypothetical protein